MSRKSPKSPKLGGMRSKFEVQIAAYLKKRGIKYGYETAYLSYLQPVRSGHCEDCKSKRVAKRRKYTPDFEVGSTLLEGKGKFTSADRTKFISIKANHPTADIRFIFMRDNFLKKGSTVTYSEWATKQGFPWCIGPSIPDAWAKEFKCDKSISIEQKSSVTAGVRTSTPLRLQRPTLIRRWIGQSAGTVKPTSNQAAVKSCRSPSSRPSVVQSSSRKAKKCQ